LAGNIANIDTPGYRTRDLSVETFQQRLKEAIQAQRTRENHQSSPGDIFLEGESPLSADAALKRVRDATKTILFHDDSDVGIEQQVTEISNNQFTHNMAIALLNNQFRQLQTVISERV